MSNKQNDIYEESKKEREQEQGIVRLYEIPRESLIYEACSDGSKYFRFKHLDGAYSYCVTEKGGVVHLSVNARLKKQGNGYILVAPEGKVDDSVSKKVSHPVEACEERHDPDHDAIIYSLGRLSYENLLKQYHAYGDMIETMFSDKDKRIIYQFLEIRRLLLTRSLEETLRKDDDLA